MKKIAILLIGAFIAALVLMSVMSCSGASKQVPSYPEVTAKKFNDTCETPDEVHAVPPIRFPIPAHVIRHKNCMGVDDLLVVAWPGDVSEKNLTAAKLLMLMYLEHQGGDLKADLLKTDKEVLEGGLTVNMAFYKIEKIKKEAQPL